MCGSRFHLNHGPFGRPGTIGRIPALQHQPFDDSWMRRRPGAARSQLPPSRRRRRAARGRCAARSSVATKASSRLRRSAKGSGAQVLAAVLQEVVGADEGRMAARCSFGDTVLRFSRCCRSANGAASPPSARADQQLAVERALEIEGVEEVGKGAGDVVAGARIEPAHAASRSPPGRGCRPISIPRHSRPDRAFRARRRRAACDSMTGRNGASAAADRLLGPALQPGEELDVGRRQPVPELLDLGHVTCRRNRPAPAWRAAP